jgi:hypothetical protein
MVPLHPRRSEQHFKTGERYTLVEFDDRSTASHNHEFAFVREAWASLPENFAERFQSPDALRKWALIRAGYSHSSSLLCESRAEAMRVAAFLKPMDDLAVVIVQGTTVTRYIAMSQSKRAMGAKEFYRSKEAIIEVIARMIDVSPQELKGVQAAI